MFKTTYLNIILSVIAIELLFLVFKTYSEHPQEALQEVSQKTAVIQAKYSMPNSFDGNAQQPTNVNIVSINGIPLSDLKPKNALPVSVYNPLDINYKKVSLEVKHPK